MRSIQDTINDAIAQLMRVNGNHNPLTYPTIRHGDLEKVPLEEIAGPITSLIQSGAISPDDELESWLRDLAGAPQHEVGDPGMMPSDEIEPGEESTPQGLDTGGKPVAAVTMNGAQVASMLSIIEQVASGTLGKGAAIKLMMTAFAVPQETALALLEEDSSAAPHLADALAPDTEADLPEEKALQPREFNVQAPGPREFNVQAPGPREYNVQAPDEDELEKERDLLQPREFNVQSPEGTIFSQYSELLAQGRAEKVPDEQLVNGSSLARRARQKLKNKRKTVRAMKPRQKGKLTNLKEVDPTTGKIKE